MLHDRISVGPKVMFGNPVIKGTWISVETILRLLDKGTSVEELMTEYELTREDVLAAQAFAANAPTRTL